MNADSIPEALRALPQWVLWRSLERHGKPTKVPFQARAPAFEARTNDPNTWATFDEALTAFEEGGVDGVGFVFTATDPFIGVDLDAKGTLDEWQADIVERLGSYAEFSPSGVGIHVIVTGELERAQTKPGLEIYPAGRYFTFTGDHVPDTPPEVREPNGALDAIVAEHFGQTGQNRTKPDGEPDGDTVGEGGRNTALASLAGSMRRQGFDVEAIEAALLAENRVRCRPPLAESEVRAIARSVGRYEPEPDPEVRWSGGEAGNGEMPPLPTLAEFMMTPFPPEVPLLGPIRSPKLIHVSGASGVGKTHFGVAIAGAIGTQRDWCHWKAHERRTVLHVDGEMPPAELQARFAQIPRNASVIPLSAIWLAEQPGVGQINLAQPIWQVLIERYLKRYDATVLQLDNVMSLVYVEGVSMSSDEFWRPMAAWLKRLRGRGITSIVYDHTNAVGQTFGTKTKEWLCDLAIQLTRPDDYEADDGCRFVMKFGKTRGHHEPADVQTMNVIFEREHWTATPAIDELISEAQELRDQGKSVRAVSTAIGKSVGWVSKHTRGS